MLQLLAQPTSFCHGSTAKWQSFRDQSHFYNFCHYSTLISGHGEKSIVSRSTMLHNMLSILQIVPSATPDPHVAAAHWPPWFTKRTKTWRALWPIWCGRYRRVADIDIACGRYSVLCGRYGCGRYCLWPISSFPYRRGVEAVYQQR